MVGHMGAGLDTAATGGQWFTVKHTEPAKGLSSVQLG